MVPIGWCGLKLCVTMLLISVAFGPISSRAAETAPPSPISSPAAETGKPAPTLNQGETAKPSKLVIALESDTRWQPAGGEFRFKITSPGNTNLPTACLGFKQEFKPDECPIELTVRRVLVSPDTPEVVTFAATLPTKLEQDWEQNAKPYYFVLPRYIISAAYLRITAGTGTDATTKLPVAITSRASAAAATLVAVILAGWALFAFSKYLGVPGPKESSIFRLWSVPLRLISTANGWASLSQFQILLWSFVVGGGAIYVMTLTGSLIPISAGTLMLLGIAGGAAVLTEVKANQQSQSGPPMPTPAKVMNLAAAGGQPSTELVITWVAPPGNAPVSGYIVQYGVGAQPEAWIEASRFVQGTGLRIVGLQPDTLYHVKVCATNPVGPGEWTDLAAKTSAAALPAASVSNVRVLVNDTTEKSIALKWDPMTPSDIVQYRWADSAEDWREAQDKPQNAGPPGTMIVTGLRSSTRYQFRVRTESAVDGWSAVATAATIHVPKWSDIVTDTNRPAEIDVTRVQMLFFTVISAFFVGLGIVNTGTIPDIPPTYVTLMGISNGVYVTAKFVRNY